MGFESNRQDHHVHGNATYEPGQRVLGADYQFAFLGRVHRPVADLSHPTAHKVDTFVQQPVIELFVALTRCSHIDVEVEDLCAGPLFDQVCELERVHAANLRAPTVSVGVTRAHAMDNAHRLGSCSIAQNHLAARRSGGVDQTLHFQRRVNVRITAVTVIGIAAGIEGLEASGQKNGSNLDLLEGLLLIEINRVAIAAGLHAGFLAFA